MALNKITVSSLAANAVTNIAVANGTITNADFRSMKFFESKSFTSNGQLALTLAGNETYDYGSDGNFLSSTAANDNIIVMVKSLGTASNVSVGDIINLNANGGIHLNIKEGSISNPTLSPISPRIFLGTKSNDTLPTEPLMLGNQTSRFLLDLLVALDSFALSLTSSATDPEGSPATKLRASGEALQTQLEPFYNRIQELLSKSTFTI